MYSTMDVYIKNFIAQIEQAAQIGKLAKITPADKTMRNIVVSGLGGSGIGGKLTAAILSDSLKVPFLLNHDYFLPGFVNQNTLLIISSYSGNTEETVQVLEEGIKRKAKIVCVTSNGKVMEMAKQHKLDFIQIPGGMPPRGCLNLSFIQQLFILEKLALIDNSITSQLSAAANLLKENEATIRNEAENVAEKLQGKLPVIYAETRMEAVAVRFRQQINENGKMLAWHHVIPEMNHNELVGWRIKNSKLAVVFLCNDDDFYRNQRRMEIVAEVARKYTPHQITINSKGETYLEKALYLIYLTDWVSFFLAKLQDRDAVEVNVIDYLKGELKKI